MGLAKECGEMYIDNLREINEDSPDVKRLVAFHLGSMASMLIALIQSNEDIVGELKELRHELEKINI